MRGKRKVEMQVRVVREIKEGEEILVRYWGVHEFGSKDERHHCSLIGDWGRAN